MIRLLYSIVIAAMAATPAAAQTSSYAGKWRIVRIIDTASAAQRAPFGPHPLLRTGLVIADDKVRGQGNLACDTPRFEELTLEDGQTFGGALPRDATRHLRRFSFGSSGVPTLRVICNGLNQDYHLSPSEELLTFKEGRILVLRKHGESQDRFPDALARIDAGFNCAKAKSAVETLVCTWPDALVADHDMNRHFLRLRGMMSAGSSQALATSQRVFNDYAARRCQLAGAMPRNVEAEKTAAACLADHLRGRADFLSDLDIVSEGRLRIEPLVITQSKLTGKGADVRGWITHEARPVLSGVSKSVTQAFEQEVRATWPTPLIAGRTDLDGEVTRGFRTGILDEAFVSLVATEHVEAGTRVPDFISALNMDLAAGKPAPLSAIFDLSESWRVVVEKAMREGAADTAEPARDIASLLRSPSGVAWLFGKEAAALYWSSGGGAPGEVTEIGAPMLKPFLKPGSPWRPQVP